ncbi:hypothetical protein ACFLZ1_00445 [Patescibacteria group bacterium]
MKLKNLLLFGILLFLAVVFSKSIFAQDAASPWYAPDDRTFQNIVFSSNESEVNAQRYNEFNWKAIQGAAGTDVWGLSADVAAQAGIRNPGAIGQMGNMVASIIANPPVSSTEYIADISSNLGLPIKSAHAQGVGWRALEPVLEVWKAFRNVVYMFFVIIFIAVGFMIMFRAKINPQTVVTIEAALPKIIVTLLLVTFSYAIAGLMIDLIYIGIYAVIGVFSLGGLITDSNAVADLLLSKNPFQLVYVEDGANIFINAPGEALQEIISGLLGDWISDSPLADLVGGLAKLILGIAVLFSLFKLFFALILSYISIILSVILSPFNLLFNAFPGSNAFVGWLKNLFANVIVFPAVAALFLIGAVLVGPRNGAPCGDFNNKWCVKDGVGYYPAAESGGEVWIPPMLNIGEGAGGVGGVNAFQGLIALGIIMMMPQVVTMIKKALKVEGTGFGGAIAGGIMAGPSAVAGMGKAAYGMGSQVYSIKTGREQKAQYGKMLDAIRQQQGGGPST